MTVENGVGRRTTLHAARENMHNRTRYVQLLYVPLQACTEYVPFD